MDNPIKDYLIHDNGSGKNFVMPKEGYDNAKRSPANHLWVMLEKVQPANTQNAWYVSEQERIHAIRNKKPFSESNNADSYFQIINRIDTNFIEGYLGHPMINTNFFSSLDQTYSYFLDYLNLQRVYFTFDRISLYQVTEMILENPIRIFMKRIDNSPYFKKNSAFMIMPFGDQQLDEFYNNHIKDFLKNEFDITVYRADNFTDNDVIIETIYKSIEECEFVIAETTINNKNAFYELGYAVAKDREVITIQNRLERSIFFDRTHVRSIMYSHDDIEKFRTELKGTILTIRSRG